MALRTVTMAELRLEVVLEAERSGESVAEICRATSSPARPTGIGVATWPLEPKRRLGHGVRIASRFGSTIVVLTVGPLLAILTWRRCRAVSITRSGCHLRTAGHRAHAQELVGRDRPKLQQLVGGNGPSAIGVRFAARAESSTRPAHETAPRHVIAVIDARRS
jgi:hypothetical protein